MVLLICNNLRYNEAGLNSQSITLNLDIRVVIDLKSIAQGYKDTKSGSALNPSSAR
ncbi:hypothetical protein PL8927_550047 [Planktothrix serta PCC 8927]|uniref:Uncharacterized protein n=1 Tax=Planktothrix serta PCC 8927 TaxID=671068 RepID=A0A7Z9BSM0_9CYAN|nr:hypothetical protein PL8927_550047 [Planktothrix serta PCC 8927]